MSDPPLNLTLDIAMKVRPVAGTLPCLEVAGDIDVRTAPRLRSALHSLIDAGHNSLVLDFTAVTYIDSSGMGVLVGALKRVREHRGRIRLICQSVAIQKLFRITGLTRIFDIFESEQALVCRVTNLSERRR